MNTKENTLDVLFYLFENYSDVDDVTQNKDALHSYLEEAGFPHNDISKAFDWLESLADKEQVYITEPSTNTTRIFSRYESRYLNFECQSYLLFLEQSKVLTPEMRERTIDRILELKDKTLDLTKATFANYTLQNDSSRLRVPEDISNYNSRGRNGLQK